jgi:hypothetical protein
MKRTISIIAIAIFGFAWKSNAQTFAQKEITPIENALSVVTKLNPINFSYDKNWAEKLRLTTPQKGFNVADAQKNNPELIINKQLNYVEGKNNVKTVVVQQLNTEAVVSLLVASIKEQQQQIDALKATINELKRKSAK